MERDTKRLFLLISAVALGLLMLASVPIALAQSGCTGDPCIFETPTNAPTPTQTATPAAGTPTVAPWPTSEAFPVPNYGMPTSIPNVSFPGTPTAILSIDLPDTPEPIVWATADLPDPITDDFASAITYSVAITLNMDGSGAVTGTGSELIDSMIISGNNRIGDVLSYTDYISGLMASIEGTGTFTITTAPDWYAPALPRDVAAVGWTIELMGDDVEAGTADYSMASWIYLFAQTVSMPIRFARGVWAFFQGMGPINLVIIWILVFFPFIFGLRLLPYLRSIFWSIVQFFEKVLYWIQELWDAIPFKMS